MLHHYTRGRGIFQMKKVALVTGATGFIGSNLCNSLYNQGEYEVIALGTSCENQPGCHRFCPLNLNGVSWDLIPDINVCFHQAANNDTTDLDWQRMFAANYTAPAQFFYDLRLKKKCKQFVYASSSSVYGNSPVPYVEKESPLDPLNPYAVSKKMFEEYASAFSLEQNVNVIGLRYTNVFGPGENHKGKRASMIHQLLQTLLKKERPKIFKNGEQRRDWVYIKDVVKANLCAAQHNGSGVFNVGSGESTSFNEIIEILNEELGTDFIPEYIDCPFLEQYQSHTLASLKHAETMGFSPEYSTKMAIKEFVRETKKAG